MKDRLDLRRADTLGVRLFVLMWAALVLSHAAAYFTVRTFHDPLRHGPDRPPLLDHETPPLPTFPSLPPTPGLRADPGFGGNDRPGPPDGLPLDALLLDYGVRLLVIAAAAWWGSRWLARPMRRLVDASSTLGAALGEGRDPVRLDESVGTLEVRNAAVVFNRMAGRMKHDFDARGLMIAAISHDLRTPLTRMRMRLETSTVDQTLRERCADDIREMNTLVDTVLEVFRSPSAAASDRPRSRLDLGALVQALVDDLAEQGQPVMFSGGAAVTLAEPIAVRRIVGNLIENAVRYGGSAAVTVRAPADGTVAVCVDDDGPGIPSDQLDIVLEPFRRLEGSRSRQSGGTGLGLFIARQLAERLGGSLRLSNRDGGGLRAELTLPG